jgi:hypothetical protein
MAMQQMKMNKPSCGLRAPLAATIPQHRACQAAKAAKGIGN